LTAEGFRGPHTASVLASLVLRIRSQYGWVSPYQKRRADFTVPGYLNALGLAARLGVGRYWVYRRLQGGLIDKKYFIPHRCRHVWLVKDDPELIERLREEAVRTRR